VKLQLGFDLTYECIDSTPMILMLNVHPSRAGDLIREMALPRRLGNVDPTAPRRAFGSPAFENRDLRSVRHFTGLSSCGGGLIARGLEPTPLFRRWLLFGHEGLL
jgi:hypothetical protein